MQKKHTDNIKTNSRENVWVKYTEGSLYKDKKIKNIHFKNDLKKNVEEIYCIFREQRIVSSNGINILIYFCLKQQMRSLSASKILLIDIKISCQHQRVWIMNYNDW